MDTAAVQFIHDVLKDSLALQQSDEPGQAFDKLARGIESRLPEYEGQSQREKARALFLKCVASDNVWRIFEEKATKLGYFVEELSYAVRSAATSEVRQLLKYASDLGDAVRGSDRQQAAFSLADFFMLMRNKRFHGHPAFSGRNIRVAISAGGFLDVVRCCIQREVEVMTPAPPNSETLS